MHRDSSSILLTGATGYVGGRLLPRLESCGLPVRCMARQPQNLRERASPDTDVVAGNVLDADSLRSAMKGVDTAYYLVHSMGSTGSFETPGNARRRVPACPDGCMALGRGMATLRRVASGFGGTGRTRPRSGRKAPSATTTLPRSRLTQANTRGHDVDGRTSKERFVDCSSSHGRAIGFWLREGSRGGR